MSKALTTEEFIQKSILVHMDKYDYSSAKYINWYTKVEIICPKHGIFTQMPAEHIRGRGCMKCSKWCPKTTDQFIEKAKLIHNNKYDYSLVVYIHTDLKVKIICPKHGIFEQSPHSHLKGCECQNCVGGLKLTKKIFIDKANKIHNFLYDYSLVEYKNIKTKVEIICPKHGIFTQCPHSHLKGSGCFKCNSSKGEIKIEYYLKQYNIKYICQHKFNDCRGIKNKLPFDFYLPDYNICIEFDGIQHYQPINNKGGYNGFLKIIKTDIIKTKYCQTNNIRLIRIPYWEIKNIESILSIYRDN